MSTLCGLMQLLQYSINTNGYFCALQGFNIFVQEYGECLNTKWCSLIQYLPIWYRKELSLFLFISPFKNPYFSFPILPSPGGKLVLKVRVARSMCTRGSGGTVCSAGTCFNWCRQSSGVNVFVSPEYHFIWKKGIKLSSETVPGVQEPSLNYHVQIHQKGETMKTRMGAHSPS